MKKSLMGAAVAVFALLAAPAYAANAACDKQAEEKKLAGAAKTSFLKKCEKDSAAAGAGSACEMKAAEKKLAGAAKNSFVKKCVSDSAAPTAAAPKK
jgi:hypothetical protein